MVESDVAVGPTLPRCARLARALPPAQRAASGAGVNVEAIESGTRGAVRAPAAVQVVGENTLGARARFAGPSERFGGANKLQRFAGSGYVTPPSVV